MHGIGSRRDLPLPFEFVIAGSAMVLLVTFTLLLWAWRQPRYATATGLRLPRLTALLDHRWFSVIAASLSFFVFCWFAMALIAGHDRLTNPVFGWVFVCIWVGLVPFSLLFGNAWQSLHPLWTIAGLHPKLRQGLATPSHSHCRVDSSNYATEIEQVTSRNTRGINHWQRIDQRLGCYPAAFALLCFAWFELIQPDRATQPVLAWWALVWLVWLIVGVLLWGRNWIAQADPFTVYANLVARLSCWQRIGTEIRLVNPLRHLATSASPRGTWAVVSVLLGSTAFDSWSQSAGWTKYVQDHHIDPMLAGVAGLTFTTSVVALTLWLSVRAMRPGLKADHHDQQLFDDIAATVAPIVVGYAIGHYASLLAIEGQRTLINASDPLGRGWNVFGTGELGVNTGLFDFPMVVAGIQLLSVLLGHVLGVFAAHEKAISVLRPGAYLSGQLALLLVMIGYTCTGLLLLFSN